MPILDLFSLGLIYFLFLLLIAKRILTYLHVLQQEDYDSDRLKKWIFENKAFDRRMTFMLVLCSVLHFFTPDHLPYFVLEFAIFFSVCWAIFKEKDPRKSPKKKLVTTERARRIFFPTFVTCFLIASWCWLPQYPYNLSPWPWIIVIQLVPFVLFAVNAALRPFESVVQKQFWNEARQKMHELQPTTIAITGSFGKTSVKHMLGHILSSQAPTLITPGSVNTPMGITRIVREQLEDTHKYFIVEMGAYGPGSIASLCELTPPDYGVITSIGHAHYERFKSLETVVRAKYELAEAVLSKEGSVPGYMVVHERTLRFAYARQMRAENRDQFTACGDPPDENIHRRKDVIFLDDTDAHILHVEQTSLGLDIKFSYQGMTYNLAPRIFGLHHAHNCVLAAVTALQLGVDINHIQMSLESLPQIPHRLEVRRSSDGSYTIIDDSYNSNPVGFRSALDLLKLLAGSSRKILITPGMVELGIAHDEAHGQIGEYASNICDVAVVIRPSRIPTFVKNYKTKGKMLIEVSSYSEAAQWLEDNHQEGDFVLIENDLPDMYECLPDM